MGAWSLYFLAKLGLYARHMIGLHWAANLAFAIALAWPLAQARARMARHVIAIPIALALLYWDSFLPPFSRLLAQLDELAAFRAGYLAELLLRFVSLRLVIVLAAVALAYGLLKSRVRFATFALLGLVAVPFLPEPGAGGGANAMTARSAAAGPSADAVAGSVAGAFATPTVPTAAELDTALQGFYAREHGRRVSMAAQSAPGFDLVVLSVCSLGADDIALNGMQQSPLLSQFDLVFRHFNSAATYSGPAVLRLLHASCGQPPQGQLYTPQPDGCYLFRNLEQAGYRPALLLNHDGHFDHFAEQLRDQGGLGLSPEDNSAAPVAMQAFDGSPVRDDYEVLSRWWQRHSASGDPHFALLYNTLSLHDGNVVPGVAAHRSSDTYKLRLTRLFDGLQRFIDQVKASGRPTVVMLVAEHGAALRGDAVQISGLRELPTPAITEVPAAIKLLGFKQDLNAGTGPIVVDRPSSYLALATLVAGLMQVDPGAGADARAALRGLADALPTTAWVAENAGTVLMNASGREYMRSPDGQWAPFDTSSGASQVAVR